MQIKILTSFSRILIFFTNWSKYHTRSWAQSLRSKYTYFNSLVSPDFEGARSEDGGSGSHGEGAGGQLSIPGKSSHLQLTSRNITLTRLRTVAKTRLSLTAPLPPSRHCRAHGDPNESRPHSDDAGLGPCRAHGDPNEPRPPPDDAGLKMLIDLARGGQPLVDWHFMQLMRKLVKRGVLDDNWEYAVDLRYLDMEFRPPQAQAHLASPVQLVP